MLPALLLREAVHGVAPTPLAHRRPLNSRPVTRHTAATGHSQLLTRPIALECQTLAIVRTQRRREGSRLSRKQRATRIKQSRRCSPSRALHRVGRAAPGEWRGCDQTIAVALAVIPIIVTAIAGRAAVIIARVISGCGPGVLRAICRTMLGAAAAVRRVPPLPLARAAVSAHHIAARKRAFRISVGVVWAAALLRHCVDVAVCVTVPIAVIAPVLARKARIIGPNEGALAVVAAVAAAIAIASVTDTTVSGIDVSRL